MTWENFTRDEFACRCGCGTNEIQDEFIDVLQEIRAETGYPFHINSGYRCPNHPREARKKTKSGEHIEGTCADIRLSHQAAFVVLKAAINHPKVTGIGVKQKGSGRFLHIGIGGSLPGRPRPHIWSY